MVIGNKMYDSIIAANAVLMEVMIHLDLSEAFWFVPRSALALASSLALTAGSTRGGHLVSSMLYKLVDPDF